MTQGERWNIRYQEVKEFILANKRNPSKYVEGGKVDGTSSEARSKDVERGGNGGTEI